MRSNSAKRQPTSLHDKWFVFSVICIVALGLLMMTSASIVISDRQMHQPFYFLFKQLIFLTLGVTCSTLCIANYPVLNGALSFLMVMLLLALVLIRHWPQCQWQCPLDRAGC